MIFSTLFISSMLSLALLFEAIVCYFDAKGKYYRDAFRLNDSFMNVGTGAFGNTALAACLAALALVRYGGVLRQDLVSGPVVFSVSFYTLNGVLVVLLSAILLRNGAWFPMLFRRVLWEIWKFITGAG